MNRKIAIIGGGPGGYVTAIRLKQKGIEPLLFEMERLGGECLNWGCIPTKALVKISDLFGEIRQAEKFGIDIKEASCDYKRISARKDEVVEKLVSGLEFICKKREIEIINKRVTRISKKGTHYILTTDGEEFEAEYIVLATGSVSAELPNLKFDGEKLLSSRHILSLKELPEHLTIIGGGTIGCEFASIFNNLGVEVEIIELLPNLMNNEDREIAKKLQLAFKKKKIKIHLGTKVEEHTVDGDELILKLSNSKEIRTDKVLISTGRVPSCQIEFENSAPKMDRGRILINNKMETDQPNIFAIGDVTGKLMLAHTASKQGLIVADIIMDRIDTQKEGEREALNYENIPRCTFTEPELASVGLTEEQAREKEIEIETGKFGYMANGKAIGLGTTDGMIKVLADKKSQKVIGMHIVGAQATELIVAGSIMVNLELKISDLQKVVYAHPTLSEIIMEAVEDLENMAIHKI
jgi:dihydrolipoamide dehydrogenase